VPSELLGLGAGFSSLASLVPQQGTSISIITESKLDNQSSDTQKDSKIDKHVSGQPTVTA
jgi:hypothetical protein